MHLGGWTAIPTVEFPLIAEHLLTLPCFSSTSTIQFKCSAQPHILRPCSSLVLSSSHPVILTYFLFLTCTFVPCYVPFTWLFPFPRITFHIFLPGASLLIFSLLILYLWPLTPLCFPSSWFSGFTSSVKSSKFLPWSFPSPSLSWCLPLIHNQIVHPIFYLSIILHTRLLSFIGKDSVCVCMHTHTRIFQYSNHLAKYSAQTRL